jgi:hypothetical protein
LFIRLVLALGIAVISAPLLLASSASAEPDPNQVVVCKYSHTPETGEIAQTIIIVNTNALEGDGFDGTFPFVFSDEQNSSIAIRFAEVGENSNELEIGECPPFGVVDECEELPGDQPEGFQCEPLTETETRDVGPTVDCDTETVTTLHQERTRTQVFVAEPPPGEWVWGDWSEWMTVDTTVVPTTEEQCPGEPIDPPNPPNPPEPTPPAPVDPPNPTLPDTGAEDYLGGLALLSGLILAGASALIWRSRRIGLPQL